MRHAKKKSQQHPSPPRAGSGIERTDQHYTAIDNMDTPEELEQRYINSKHKFIGQLIILVTLVGAFLYLAGKQSDIHNKKDLTRQQDQKMAQWLNTPDSSKKLIDELAIKAVKACGHDERCLDKWTEREVPMFLDQMDIGFTDANKRLIRDYVLRQANKPEPTLSK